MVCKLLLGAALLPPATLPAQFLQNVTTADYSLRTLLTKLSDTQYVYQVQFRNEQLFETNRIFGIPNLTILGIPAGFVGVTVPGPIFHFIGAVGTGTLTTTQRASAIFPNDAILYNPVLFASAAYFPGAAYVGAESSNPAEGYGLLGCSAPLTVGRSVNYYAGSTCAAAGFTGWAALDFSVTFDQPRPTYMGAEIVTWLGAVTDRVTTFQDVPEAATFALVGSGCWWWES